MQHSNRSSRGQTPLDLAGSCAIMITTGSGRNRLFTKAALVLPTPFGLSESRKFSNSHKQERRPYLSLCKNLKAPPGREQWHKIRTKLDRLADVLKTSQSQRLYLEVVWNLAAADRDIFLDETGAAAVIKVFPSLNALKNLADRHSRQWLKELFEACLQYQQGTPSRENIKRLFAALLETQLPLAGHDHIPDHFLSGYMAREDSAVFIPVTPPVQTPEELALHFTASVMGVLSDMFYDYQVNRLKIEQYGGESHSFPAPRLKIHDDGLEISNWTAEVFERFLAMTEFLEHYYLSEDYWQQQCQPEAPGYFQRKIQTCQQRERAAPEVATFQPLSVPALLGLLKHNIAIKPAALRSFDHHKARLPRAAHGRLLSEIQKAAHKDIPVTLKEYLESSRPGEKDQPSQNEISTSANPPPAAVVELLGEEEQFQRLWADLSRKERVVIADLELLAGYTEHMTMQNIVSILKRTDAGTGPYRLDEFRQLLGEKRDQYLKHDPLLLDLPDEISDYLIETDI